LQFIPYHYSKNIGGAKCMTGFDFNIRVFDFFLSFSIIAIIATRTIRFPIMSCKASKLGLMRKNKKFAKKIWTIWVNHITFAAA